jgi:hypothetical protein
VVDALCYKCDISRAGIEAAPVKKESLVERQHIAYLLIAALLAVGIAWLFHIRHNTHERRWRRNDVREEAAYRKSMFDRRQSGVGQHQHQRDRLVLNQQQEHDNPEL